MRRKTISRAIGSITAVYSSPTTVPVIDSIRLSAVRKGLRSSHIRVDHTEKTRSPVRTTD